MTHLTDEQRAEADVLIDLALREDLGEVGDLSSLSVISDTATGSVRIAARETGVTSGLPVVRRVFEKLDPNVRCECETDGAPVEKGTVVARITGPVRSLLSGERTALNFLCHLSGVASSTRSYVDAVAGTSARILDTRKTLPGWRRLQKYAVHCGGGTNHRMGLHDGIMLKDNHLAAWSETKQDLATAARTAREFVETNNHKVQFVQVEVDTLEQLDRVFEGRPDIILLDNMPPDDLREAVRRRDAKYPNILLEASGGITHATVRAIAETGVDRISIGALTHSVKALDFGFDWAD